MPVYTFINELHSPQLSGNVSHNFIYILY